jgi:hypothetical protein
MLENRDILSWRAANEVSVCASFRTAAYGKEALP